MFLAEQVTPSAPHGGRSPGETQPWPVHISSSEPKALVYATGYRIAAFFHGRERGFSVKAGGLALRIRTRDAWPARALMHVLPLQQPSEQDGDHDVAARESTGGRPQLDVYNG